MNKKLKYKIPDEDDYLYMEIELNSNYKIESRSQSFGNKLSKYYKEIIEEWENAKGIEIKNKTLISLLESDDNVKNELAINLIKLTII